MDEIGLGGREFLDECHNHGRKGLVPNPIHQVGQHRDRRHRRLRWGKGAAKRIVDGDIIWAAAINGAFVLTTRGGDFELNIGQDVSIGYLSHTDTVVRLYLQETFTFRVLTSEASVAFSKSEKASA